MNVRVGTIGDTPIIIDTSRPCGAAIDVFLLADYELRHPHGPNYVAWFDPPKVLRAGSVYSTHHAEAAALVAAGAAIIDSAVAIAGTGGVYGSARPSEIISAIKSEVYEAVIEQIRAGGPPAELIRALDEHLKPAIEASL